MTPAQRRALGYPEVSGAGRDDVVALQTRVSMQMVAMAVVVEGCKATLDPATLTAWDDVARHALAYASADPGAGSADAQVTVGTALLTELNSWGPRLAALGCSNTPPPVPAPPPPTPSPGWNPFAALDLSGIGPLLLVGLALFAFGQSRR